MGLSWQKHNVTDFDGVVHRTVIPAAMPTSQAVSKLLALGLEVEPKKIPHLGRLLGLWNPPGRVTLPETRPDPTADSLSLCGALRTQRAAGGRAQSTTSAALCC